MGNDGFKKFTVLSKEGNAMAITAVQKQCYDAWLADEGYDYWVLDTKSNTAYSIKLTREDEFNAEYSYCGVHVIGLKARQVKKICRIFQWKIWNFRSPSKRSKANISIANSIVEGIVQVYNMTTLELIKVTEIESDNKINSTKKVKGRINQPEDRHFIGNLVMPPDEKEIYVSLEDGELRKGGVTAIDIAQKKLIRGRLKPVLNSVTFELCPSRSLTSLVHKWRATVDYVISICRPNDATLQFIW